MKKELPKAYDAGLYEEGVYKKWEESGFFNPDNLSDVKEKYCNVLPPPNANGELHIGHVSGYVVMDLLGRYNRMLGKKTLLLPGKDHAGIQTQVVYEKKIKKERGVGRHDLGREDFYREIYDFCIDRSRYMRNQERKMGLSADWSREKFTLDPDIINIAIETFVKMYNEIDEQGNRMVYRGERIINWCPRCASALADVEVEHEEQKSKLYTFKYSKDMPFAVASTRPETKLADTAIAVNPDDDRYREFIGKEFEVDFVGVSLKLRVVADKEIDPNFGTGAIGVTPGHSAIDWRMAQDNNLAVKKLIDEKAQIMAGYGEFSGKSAVEAREMVADKLREAGLMEKEEDIDNNISVCERCKSVIEPLVSLQWFVNVDHANFSLKKEAGKVVKNNEIKIYPERFQGIMLGWIDNVYDWCISRQIWWGPRIPAWYRRGTGKVWKMNLYGEKIYSNIKENKKTIETRAGREKGQGKNWEDFKVGDTISFSSVIGEDERVLESGLQRQIIKTHHYNSIDEMLGELDLEKISPELNREEYEEFMNNLPGFKERLEKYGVWAFELGEPMESETYVGMEPPEGDGWVQDEDTFDTWFSSGQWAYTTLGYPDGGDFNEFYPSDTMVMGRDILPFWAFRMVILSLYRTRRIPFKNLYFTGLVRDEKGQKMSKSKGNGIEPLDMIVKYGTDAVRLSLTIGAAPGNDMNLGEAKIAGFRNMVNKLWNVSRYIIDKIGEHAVEDLKYDVNSLSLADKWILGKKEVLIKNVTDSLNDYSVSRAGELLREFLRNDLADWYIEASKFEESDNKAAVLAEVLRDYLKLSHPFIPFVTEVLWDEIFGDNLIIQKWPKVNNAMIDTKSIATFESLVQAIIISIRGSRVDNNIEPSRKVKAVVYAGKHADFIVAQKSLLVGLRTGIGELEVTAGGEEINDAIKISIGEVVVYLIGAVDKEKERERIEKEIAKKEAILKSIESKLGNEEFIEKAPAALVQKQKDNYDTLKKEIEALKGRENNN